MDPIRIALDNTLFEGNDNAYLLGSNGETTLVNDDIATEKTR
jgi:hypothetical protein